MPLYMATLNEAARLRLAAKCAMIFLETVVFKLAQSEFSFINRDLPRGFKLREFKDNGFKTKRAEPVKPAKARM